MEFKRWILKVIGEDNYRKLDSNILNLSLGSHDREGPRMRELMRRWDPLKKSFSTTKGDMWVDLPQPLHNLNRDSKIKGGEVTISK
jgi:hypothetical protein